MTKNHLSLTGRLALRRTWITTGLRPNAVALLYGVSKATAQRLVAGLRRPDNPRDEEPDYSQLRVLFTEESGCRSEPSWVAAFANAAELEAAQLREFLAEECMS
jgi:hypothetical protein